MKRFLVAMLVVAFFSVSFSAIGPVKTTLYGDGAYEWVLDTVISNVAEYDTTGTTDADTIVVKSTRFNKSQDWEYMLNLGTVTGADVATCSIAVVINSYGRNDSCLASVYIDSVLAATDCIKLLRFFDVPGLKHDIVLQGFGSNGAEIIFNEIELYKRRPVQIMRRW